MYAVDAGDTPACDVLRRTHLTMFAKTAIVAYPLSAKIPQGLTRNEFLRREKEMTDGMDPLVIKYDSLYTSAPADHKAFNP